MINKQPLSSAQKTIVQGILQGKPLKEIAFELGKSHNAVKVDLHRARQRAGVENNFQLVALSVLQGWCSIQAPDFSGE